jgi:hypothetical protein
MNDLEISLRDDLKMNWKKKRSMSQKISYCLRRNISWKRLAFDTIRKTF